MNFRYGDAESISFRARLIHESFYSLCSSFLWIKPFIGVLLSWKGYTLRQCNALLLVTWYFFSQKSICILFISRKSFALLWLKSTSPSNPIFHILAVMHIPSQQITLSTFILFQIRFPISNTKRNGFFQSRYDFTTHLPCIHFTIKERRECQSLNQRHRQGTKEIITLGRS